MKGKSSLWLIVLLMVLPPIIARAQSPGASPTYGDVRLSAGFDQDPWAKHLIAGGGITPSMGGCSYGYVADAPDVDLYWDGSGSTLYIYVMSKGDVDATLLVNTPDGGWMCNDDSFGDSDPFIVIPNAPSGLYDIWVGTYGSDPFGATLFISELDPETALGGGQRWLLLT